MPINPREAVTPDDRIVSARRTESESPAHSEAATAAETFAMHRMTQRYIPSWLVATMAAICATCMTLPASAQMVRHADIDFEGSGFVTPAGMVPPGMFQGGVMQVDHQAAYGSPYNGGYHDTMVYGGDGYADGGFYDSGYCDGSCDGSCDGGWCDSPGSGRGGCCGLFQGGLLGRMCTGDGSSCLRRLCLFCRGDGCSACQGWKFCASALSCLLPYSEAGIGAQRWYDVSAEAIFLGHSSGGQAGILATNGIGGDPVLDLGSTNVGDSLQGGVRVSGSLIFGVASNMELTYIGGQEWDDFVVAFGDPAGTPNLFSVISDFGNDPFGGFDDTDRSIAQSLESRTAFHSAEWNYRRCTVSPCCRFQGSWLVGLRYLRFDHRMTYSALGENDNTVNANLPRFFSSSDKVKNNLFGPQAGFDLWWNVMPGVNFGVGMKGAWVQNDAKRQTIFSGNSLDPFATPGSIAIHNTERDGTVIGEFETSLIYRLTHSWSLRTSYYAIAADDIAFGTVDAQVARQFVTGNPVSDPVFQRNSLVVQGVSFGTEYMW